MIVDYRFAGHKQSGMIADRAARSGAQYRALRSGKGSLARNVTQALLGEIRHDVGAIQCAISRRGPRNRMMVSGAQTIRRWFLDDGRLDAAPNRRPSTGLRIRRGRFRRDA